MEDLYDPEEKILCPYNNSHHIRRCRMSFHLVKCKQVYGEQKMIPCDFNTTHMVPEPELQYHHQICPDRKKIEAPIVASRTKTENRFPIPNIDVATDESWDDFNVPSYDPTKYTESNDIIRHLDVASGAKRKNFRLGERQRLNELNRETNVVKVQSSTEKVAKLPPHEAITVVSEERKFDKAKLKEELRMGKDKVYLQYDKLDGPGPSNE